MSRSVHTTKKDLARERLFGQQDAVPPCDAATEAERADINKSLHKLNEVRKRQAEKQNAPTQAELALGEHDIVRNVTRRRTSSKSKP